MQLGAMCSSGKRANVVMRMVLTSPVSGHKVMPDHCIVPLGLGYEFLVQVPVAEQKLGRRVFSFSSFKFKDAGKSP